MDDLVTWLRARIAAKRVLAEAATTGPWRHDPTKHHREPGACRFSEAVFAGGVGTLAVTVAVTGETDDQQSMVDAAFIAANDPADVLAQCEAHARILDAYDNVQRRIDENLAKRKDRRYADRLDGLVLETSLLDGREQGLRYAIEHIGSTYQHNPGYQDRWRP